VATDAIVRRVLPLAFLKRHLATLVGMTGETPLPVVRNLMGLGGRIVNYLAGDTSQLASAVVETSTRLQSQILPPEWRCEEKLTQKD
jgi:hypothetical protein